MSMSRIVPPVDYLREASRSSLQSFELARLNHAANLKREIGALIDQWIKETSEAMLARWMLDHQRSLEAPTIPGSDLFQAFLDAGNDPAANSSAANSSNTPNEIVSAQRSDAEPCPPARATLSRKQQTKQKPNPAHHRIG